MKKQDAKCWATNSEEVLFQNKNWSIEKYKDNEIVITDGWITSFGWYDKNSNLIRYDWIPFPKYIGKKAIQLARLHIESFYN